MNDNLISEIIDLNKVKANLMELQKMWEQLITTMSAKSSKDLKFDDLAQNLKTVTTAEKELANVKQAGLEVDKKKVKITAEIIANYEKYGKEEQKIIENEIKRKHEIRETNKLLKDKFTNEQNLVKILQRETKSIADLDKQNKDLQRIQQKLNLTTKEGVDANAKINAQIEKNKQTTKEYTNAIDKQRRNVGNYPKDMGQATKATGGFTKGLAAMAVGITAAIAVVRKLQRYVVDVVKTFAEFDYVQAQVKAISGATAKEMDALRNSAKRLGAATEKTAAEVSQLQLNLAKLGFTATEINAATDAIVKLSIATGEDLARSAEIMAGVMNAFSLPATEAARIADVMAASFSSSALNLEKFKLSMGKVAPVAAELGYSIETVSGWMAVLADANIDAGTSSAMMRGMLISVNEKGISLAEALDMVANSTDAVGTATELFNERAAPVAVVLAKNADKADELTKSFENSAGAADKMAAIMADTLQGDLKKAESSIEALKISLGESENNGLRGIVQGFSKAIDTLTASGVLIEYLDMMKDQAMMIFKPFQNLFKLFGEGGDAADGLAKAFRGYLKVIQIATTPVRAFWAGLDAITSTIVEVVDALKKWKDIKFQDVLNIINKALVKLIEPFSDLVGMTDEVKKFFGVQRDEITATAEELEKFKKSLFDFKGLIADVKAQVEQNKLIEETNKLLEEENRLLEEKNKALEEAKKRYQSYLDAIKKANEEAKLQIALGEGVFKTRVKELEAIYAATKAYYELNGYTADEIKKLKELRAEINKLNAEIANTPKLLEKHDVKTLESGAKATGEISMNIRDVAPALNEAAAGLDKMDLITAKLRNAFNDFFGATEPIEDWRDTFKDSISQVVYESLNLYNEIIEMQSNQLEQELEAINIMYDKQVSTLDDAYEKRKSLLEATIDDEEELAEALARIEEEKTATYNKMQDEKIAKEQEVAKKRAILEKKRAAMEVATGSSIALVEAIKLLGIATTTAAPGDPYSVAARIAAALAAALTVVGAVTTGIAKVKAIQIPEFWAGGEAQEGQLISVAERGKELAIGESGQAYMFDKHSVLFAPEKMRIFSNKETNKIMEKQTINNTYEKQSNVNLTIAIDNERHKKYFKLN